MTTSYNLPNWLGTPATCATWEAWGLVLSGWVDGERRERVISWEKIESIKRDCDPQLDLFGEGAA